MSTTALQIVNTTRTFRLYQNFLNILRAAFSPIFWRQKLQSQNVTREKLCKALSFKKMHLLNVDEIDPSCQSFLCFWGLRA